MRTILLASLAALIFITYSLLRRRRRLPVPPGPPGLPLIGNLFDIPKSLNWVAYRNWSEQYSALFVSYTNT